MKKRNLNLVLEKKRKFNDFKNLKNKKLKKKSNLKFKFRVKMPRRRRFGSRKMKRFLKFRNKFKINFRVIKIRKNRKFVGSLGTASSLGEAYAAKKNFRRNRRKKIYLKAVSTKMNLNLFKLTYDILLNYHVPLGKRSGEWKVGIQLTNVLLIRNNFSLLNITTIFFELRKGLNRIFKALKLRKGVAVLNGRKYGWKRLFTFVFEKWLPGFFTNFWLNINELLSYFFKRRCLTRRQKARIMSLKMLNYDVRFLNKKKMASKKKSINLISYIKLPTVSLSLIDNFCWMRECLKEGIATMQIADSSTQVDKVDYPLVANQSSIPFLSFISLLIKEAAYQARYWEIRNFNVKNYYKIQSKLKANDGNKEFKKLLKLWIKKHVIFRKNKQIRRRRRFKRYKKYDQVIINKIRLYSFCLKNRKN